MTNKDLACSAQMQCFLLNIEGFQVVESEEMGGICTYRSLAGTQFRGQMVSQVITQLHHFSNINESACLRSSKTLFAKNKKEEINLACTMVRWWQPPIRGSVRSLFSWILFLQPGLIPVYTAAILVAHSTLFSWMDSFPSWSPHPS